MNIRVSVPQYACACCVFAMQYLRLCAGNVSVCAQCVKMLAVCRRVVVCACVCVRVCARSACGDVRAVYMCVHACSVKVLAEFMYAHVCVCVCGCTCV